MTETTVASFILGGLIFLSGAVLMSIARSAAAGRLGRSAFAGIRTSATTASDEAWRAAHERAVVPYWWGGAVSLVAGLAMIALGFTMVNGSISEATGDQILLALVVPAMLGMLGFVCYGGLVGYRAARQVNATANNIGEKK